MELNTKCIKELVNAYGPSGNENIVRNYIKEEIKDYVDEIEIDNLGNLIARKKGKGKKVMIAAHMDQIGFMVTDIDDKGFIHFTNIGGISTYNTLSQQVIFENGTLGVIASEPIEEISKLKLSDMFIDIGSNSKEETKKLVNIGDTCIYHSNFSENKNVIFSKCLDNRIGCYVAIEVIKKIKDAKNDLYFVFTTQEEVGLRGAKTAAYRINPEIGIALDVTSSGDTPNAKTFAVSLNKGTAIKVRDNSIIAHPKIKQLMVDVAKKNNIPYQMEVLEFGGTDSGAIHLIREGVPSGVISIPTRNVHSTIEMASKNDIKDSIRLLLEILNKNILL